jgi:peroxiredoxin
VSEEPPVPPGDEQPPAPYRLDPERALAQSGHGEPPKRPAIEPVIDTRRYRWMIGIFGIALVIAFSVYMFSTRGVQTAGVPAGSRLHNIVAPLAGSGLTGAANTNPHCNPAHPNPQALNLCARTPIVLALFATGSTDCKNEVNTVQAVSHQFPAGVAEFAAVAVAASGATTEKLVRSHHWTIPVAYDPDGRVGELYGVSICPLVELAYRGGVVADRLIGNHWLSAPALAAKVRAMLDARR